MILCCNLIFANYTTFFKFKKMAKIPVSFKEQVTNHPNQKYAVIVKTESDIDFGKFDLVAIDGLENLLKGKLSGYQILALEKLRKVAFIELDGEININK